MLGELVQTTDGKWMTRLPARCPHGHTLGAGQVLMGHQACLGHGGGHTTWTCHRWETTVYGPPLNTALHMPRRACGCASLLRGRPRQSESAMTTLGGGGVGAYGLNYQYLATADYFLRYLGANPELIPRATLVVDPLVTKSDGKEDDIVDFAIEIDSEPTHSVQVKSSLDPAEYPLQPAQARDVLQRLLSNQAPNSLILTNKPLSPQLLGEAEAEGTQDQRTTYVWSAGRSRLLAKRAGPLGSSSTHDRPPNYAIQLPTR